MPFQTPANFISMPEGVWFDCNKVRIAKFPSELLRPKERCRFHNSLIGRRNSQPSRVAEKLPLPDTFGTVIYKPANSTLAYWLRHQCGWSPALYQSAPQSWNRHRGQAALSSARSPIRRSASGIYPEKSQIAESAPSTEMGYTMTLRITWHLVLPSFWCSELIFARLNFEKFKYMISILRCEWLALSKQRGSPYIFVDNFNDHLPSFGHTPFIFNAAELPIYTVPTRATVWSSWEACQIRPNEQHFLFREVQIERWPGFPFFEVW